MRVEYGQIILSRRNLRVLLAKLDGFPTGSACAIYKDGFYVRAEEDAAHYGDRLPGEMVPETENRLDDEPQGA